MRLVLRIGVFGSPIISARSIELAIRSESRNKIGNAWTRLIDATLDYICLTNRVQAKQYLFDVFSANSTCYYKYMAFRQLEYLTNPEFQHEFRIDEQYGHVTFSILVNNKVLIRSNINTNEYILEYPDLGGYIA